MSTCTMIYLKFQRNEIKSIMEIAFAGAWEADISGCDETYARVGV